MSTDNTTPRTAWAITAGEYSDYRVLAICVSFEVADAQIKAMGGNPDAYGAHRIEEFPYLIAPVAKTEKLFMTVTIWDDGTVNDERQSLTEVWAFEEYEPLMPVRWRWVRAPMHQNKGGRLEVTGSDIERVRRVYSDRRAELLATPSMARRKEIRG